MIRAFEPADEDDMIREWLASTIPGQSFLPEEHWRAMEPEIRALVPIAEIWVVDEDGEIVAFMSLLVYLSGGLFTHPDQLGKGLGRALVVFIRRREVVQFVANNAGRAHYDTDKTKPYQKAVDAMASYEVMGRGAVYYELLGIGQALASAPDTTRLVEELQPGPAGNMGGPSPDLG